MRKILNGRIYDTETATPILENYGHGGSRDFDYLRESLYRKRNGEYFAVGEGGPKSRYAVRVGRSTYEGASNVFRPLSITDAMEIVETYGDADLYEQTFGTLSEEDETTQISGWIPGADKARLDAARVAGHKLADVVAAGLDALDALDAPT
jgi:hypothetical protein